MRSVTSKLNPLQAARALFFLNALVWFAFGVASLWRMDETTETGQSVTVIIGVLMFGNAGAMLLAGLGLRRRQRLFYLFALGVLVVNILLTFTDQFGLFDFLTLLLDLGLVTILLWARQTFLPPGGGGSP
jgi:hypothetical protein